MTYSADPNCKSVRQGRCLHQAAPRSLFGAAGCILVNKSNDVRIPEGCTLQVEYTKPKHPPKGPLNEAIGDMK